MAARFNYFMFISEESCFAHHFGIADGSEYYSTIPMSLGCGCYGDEASRRRESEEWRKNT